MEAEFMLGLHRYCNAGSGITRIRFCAHADRSESVESETSDAC